MRNVWTIVKKELKRVFTDKRVIFSLFLLPPLTIYLIYGLMGISAEKESEKVESYRPTVYVINSPEEITGNINPEHPVPAFEAFIHDVQRQDDLQKKIYPDDQAINMIHSDEEIEDLKDRLEKGEFDMLIEFPENFNHVVENEITNSPQINVYYFMNSNYSKTTMNNFVHILNQYKDDILKSRFEESQLRVFTPMISSLGDENKEKGSMLATILPLLLVIYLMAGAMGIGIESIAGEKERGTIATLLITPIKRSQLAIGKIISIAIIAILSSIASFLGLFAVLPQFAKATAGATGQVSYGLLDYGMILGVMFSAVLLFVAMIVIISTYAKTVKEAGTLVMPVYLVVMGAAFFNMFTQEISQSVISYIIPIYNIVIALKATFMFELTLTNWLVTVGSTLLLTMLLVFLLQKMFRSEKIMFNK